KDNREYVSTYNIGYMAQSPLKLYWKHPTKYEEFSLFRLNLTHKFTQNNWKKSKHKNIVRIFPQSSSLHNGPQ
ncbi:11013_t:CDS:1, partial [Racocetra persica]